MLPPAVLPPAVPPLNVASFGLHARTVTASTSEVPQTVSNFATNISAGPSNEAAQTLTFTVSVTNATGGLTFSGPIGTELTTISAVAVTAEPKTGSATPTMPIVLMGPVTH